jgi:RND family efflux transporter MFP subunit
MTRHALARRLLLLTALTGCGAPAGTPPRASSNTADSLPLALVSAGVVEAPETLPAQLYVEHDAMVVARERGIIESIGADLGMRVAQGQLLAQLEDTDQQIALARAREAAASATRLALRVRQLTPIGGSTPADSEAVESQLREAELSVRQAERDLALTRVTAPFAGVVSARMARAGRLAEPGDSLFRITALGPLLINVQLPESASAGVHVGSEAEVRGLGAVRTTAKVIRLAPVVDAASGTVPVVLEARAAPGLRPGAAVTVLLGKVQRQVLAVPGDAIGEDGFALVEVNGRQTARAVTLGDQLDDGRIEVRSGLSAGEAVVRSAR